jgi:hypothetical protein
VVGGVLFLQIRTLAFISGLQYTPSLPSRSFGQFLRAISIPHLHYGVASASALRDYLRLHHLIVISLSIINPITATFVHQQSLPPKLDTKPHNKPL